MTLFSTNKKTDAKIQHNPFPILFNNHLTSPYQKDCARYIFSVKRKETQEKWIEMETIIAEGYKSIDSYRINAACITNKISVPEK